MVSMMDRPQRHGRPNRIAHSPLGESRRLDRFELRDLWREYQLTRSIDLRNRLALHYLTVVYARAARLIRRLPLAVEYDDLTAAGAEGLLQAVEGFEPGRRLAFTTYATRRVNGAMLDYLREADPAPRITRRRHRQVTSAREIYLAERGREMSHEQLAARFPATVLNDSTVRSYQSLTHPVGETNSGRTVHVADVLPDPDASDVDDAAQRREWIDNLTRGFSRAEKLVIVLYYFDDMTMKETGQALGLSESRVSQMHKSILKRLKARFSPHESRVPSHDSRITNGARDEGSPCASAIGLPPDGPGRAMDGASFLKMTG